MNSRQVNLLKRLVIERDYHPIQFFAKDFNVSGKTLSKDISEIDKIIIPIGAWIEKKQGIGIKLEYTALQLEKLNSILHNTKFPQGDVDLELRRSQMLLGLLINTNKYITIQKLSDRYMVSRTSISNDLNDIEKRLSKYNLKISKTLKGTKVEGSEINIRKALVSFIQEYGEIDPSYIIEYQNIRHQELGFIESSNIMDSEVISFFEDLLNSFENKLKLVIYEPYYTNLLTHLVIMTRRIINGNGIEDNLEVEYSKTSINEGLYNSAIYLIREIQSKFNIKIDDGEIEYIYKYLISMGLSYQDKENKNNDNNLPYVNFTRSLIEISSSLLDIDCDFSFYDRLLLHIKPMLNRVKYNIQIKNPLLDDFLREFEEEFYIMKVACYLTCIKYNINIINNHEIAYILSYFISELEKIRKDIKIKAMVICHSGYGSSQILATRLEKAFNNIEIVNVISSNSISNVNLNEIDLIVSTVELEIEKSYFIVSAFLSEIDKKNLENYIDEMIKYKQKVYTDGCTKIISLDGIGKFNESNVIEIANNVYISLVFNKGNLITRYKNENGKEIYVISYSSYGYLSKALRNIIRKGKE